VEVTCSVRQDSTLLVSYFHLQVDSAASVSFESMAVNFELEVPSRTTSEIELDCSTAGGGVDVWSSTLHAIALGAVHDAAPDVRS
jgi:hypothetical protein